MRINTIVSCLHFSLFLSLLGWIVGHPLLMRRQGDADDLIMVGARTRDCVDKRGGDGSRRGEDFDTT